MASTAWGGLNSSRRRKTSFFDVEDLHHRLDHEIGVSTGLLKRGGRAQPFKGHLHRVGGQFALRHPPFEVLAVGEGLLQLLFGHIMKRYLIAMQRRLDGDLRPHLARTRDTNLAEFFDLHSSLSSG